MLDVIDVNSIIKASPSAIVIFSSDSPKFSIVEVSDAYLSVSKSRREDMIGLGIKEAFQGGLNSFSENLHFSLSEVIRTKAKHKITTQEYDFRSGTDTEAVLKYWNMENIPVLDKDNSITCIIHKIEDITEKIHSENYNEILVNNTKESFILLDKDLRIVSFNKQFFDTYASYFGRSVKKGDNILDYATAGRREIVADIYKRVLNGEEEVSVLNIPVAENKEKCFEITYKPANNLEGSRFGVFVSIADITTQQESKKLLENSEKRFRTLIENGGDAVAILDTEGKPFYVTSSIKKVLGYSEEEILSLDLFSILHPDDHESVAEVMKNAIENPGTAFRGHTSRIKNKNGEWRWIEASVINMLDDPSIAGIIDNFRDITEKMEAEIRLKESEKTLREAQRLARIGNWKLDLLSNKLDWSEEIFRIFELNPEDSRADHLRFIERVHPEDRENVEKAYATSIIEKKGYNILHRIVCPSGRIKYVVEDGKTIYDKEGRPLYSIGTVQDVTETRMASEAIRHSREALQKILDQSLDVICTLDSQGTFTQVSAAAKRTWGYAPEEMLNRSFLEFVVEEDHQATMKIGNDVLQHGEVNDFQNRYITKSGSIVQMEWSISWESNEGLYYCVGKDVTEKKKAELQRNFERKDKEALINSTDDLVWSVSRDFRLIAANNAFLKNLELFSGIKLLPGDSIMPEHVFPPEFLLFWKELYTRALNGEVFKYDLFTPAFEGVSFDTWSEISFNPIYSEGEIVGIACYERNMTERKIAEQKIKDSEAELAEAQRLAKLGSWSMEIETGRIVWSDELNRIFEVNGEEFNPGFDTILNVIVEEDKEKVTNAILEASAQGNSFTMDYRIVTPSGTKKYIHILGYGQKNTDDKVIRLFGTAQDVTQGMETQKALKESNTRFEYVSKATFDAIWDWDLEKDLIYWGENFENIFGHQIKYLKSSSESWTDNIHVDDLSRIRESIFLCINGSQDNWQDEYRFKKADGSYAYVVDRGIVIRNANGKGIRMIGSMQDITVQKKRQQHLNLLESVITKSNDSILITEAEPLEDPGPRIMYVNDAFTRMTGYEAEEVIGKNPRILQGPDSDKEKLKMLGESLRKWEPSEIEIINYKKSGEPFWINFSVTPVADEKGWFTHWIAIERDVTERKIQEEKMAEANNKIKNILESIQDGFFSVDQDSRVTYWNTEVERLSGVESSTIVGENFWKFFPKEENKTLFEASSTAREKNISVSFDKYFNLWKGWSEVSIYPSDDGLTVYLKDISERKKAEEKLNELHQELKKNVKALAVSNTELEQFAYVASHDLQEPLRMISSFLTQLEKKYDHVLDEKGKKYIFFAVDGARRMRQIILDLLEFSRIGKVYNETEDIDIGELLEEIKILNRKIISEKHAKIIWKDLPVIHASKPTIRQVFQNLIINGIKYQRHDTKPLIEIKATETDTHWKFSISDNGLGINSEYFEKIFIIFQRLHSKEEYSGTGMGLAICKKIVENHKGRIWVESEENQGSTFYFTILKNLSEDLNEVRLKK